MATRRARLVAASRVSVRQGDHDVPPVSCRRRRARADGRRL